MAGCRAGSRQQPLELQRRDHVGVAPQPILVGQLRPVDLVAGSQDHRTDLEYLVTGHHVVIDGIDAARKGATHALGADTARQAAGRLGLSRLIVVAAFDLGEAADSIGDRHLRQRHSRLTIDMAEILSRVPHDRQLGLGGRLHVVALQIADDRTSGGVAALDGLDHESGTRDRVPCREDTLAGCRQRVRVDGNLALRRNPDPGVIRDESQSGSLSDREDHRVARDDVRRIRDLGDLEAAGVVELERFDFQTFDPGHSTVFAGDLLEAATGMDCDSLGFGGLDLPGVGRHLGLALDASHVHFASQPHRTAGDIDGHIAAAEHQDSLAERWSRVVCGIGVVLAQPHVTEEQGVDQHSVEVRPGDRQPHPFVGPGGDQHRVVTVVEEIVQVLNPVVELEVDSEIDDVLHLAVDDLGRQPELGNTEPQHSAGDRHCFVNAHAVAGHRQILRRGEAARPRSDDRHTFLVDAGHRLDRLARLGQDLVGYEALECPDVDRLVDLSPVAGGFAAVIADPAADAGERVVQLYDPSLNMSGMTTGQTLAQSPQPIHTSTSTYRGWRRTWTR